jgi:uncharacterized protein
LSSPPNPLFPAAESPIEPQPPVPLSPATSLHDEDPPWTGWDVIAIAALTLFLIFLSLLGATFAARRFLFPTLPMAEVAQFPLVTVAAQSVAYLLVLAFMLAIVKRGVGQSFGRAIRFNWPRNWAGYLFGGAALAIGLQALAHFLPMPKDLPIDRFFQTTLEAWALSLFGMTMAPLLEELFFRGFLYPVLVRKWGMILAIVLTAAGFGLIHAPQLGRAWAPVLVVFLVGLTLTITRAVTKSVAASLLIHIAYNGTISVLIFAASDGFRHLERLNQ